MNNVPLILVVLLGLAGLSRVNAQDISDSVTVQKTTNSPIKEPVEVLDPIEIRFDQKEAVLLSDSLYRWRYVRNVYEWMNRTNGFITARQGITGHSAGIWFRGSTAQQPEVTWESLPFADPFTGQSNLSFIPLRNARRLSFHKNTFQTDFQLRTFALAKPWTDILNENAALGYRVFSAVISQNITSRTNASLMIHGTDENGFYERSTMQQFQTSGTVYHQFSQRRMVKAAFVLNKNQLNQPDGFEIPNQAFFSFGQFDANARDFSGASDTRSMWAKAEFVFQGKNPNSFSGSVGLFRNATERFSVGLGDTTEYNASETGLFGLILTHNEWLKTQNTISASLVGFEHAARNTHESQFRLSGSLENGSKLPIPLRVEYGAQLRGDSQSSGRFSATFPIPFGKQFSLAPFASFEAKMPSFQDLWFSNNSFSGNDSLKYATYTKLGLTSEIKTAGFLVGVDAGIFNTKREVFLLADSSLANGPDYAGFFGDARVSFYRKTWETTISATYFSREGNSQLQIDPYVTSPDAGLWIKSEFMYKNYVFQKAAYMNVGFRSLFSPFAYRTAMYVPALDRWMMPLHPEEIPGFFRLDIFLNARVRQLFFYYQIENVLHGLGQAGYFETALYPMLPRRSRFGIRWVIRN